MIAYRIDLFTYIYQGNSKGPHEDFRRIVEALEANNCLREFHLKARIDNPYLDYSIIIEHLCRNKTLSEVTIDLRGEYKGELPLCVSSTQYFTCLHLGREPCRGSIPSPTECFTSWISPF